MCTRLHKQTVTFNSNLTIHLAVMKTTALHVQHVLHYPTRIYMQDNACILSLNIPQHTYIKLDKGQTIAYQPLHFMGAHSGILMNSCFYLKEPAAGT